MFAIIMHYAIFAFILNFIREIIKDLEDIKGDYSQGMRTLPIIFGENNTAKLSSILCNIPIVLVLFYINNNLMFNQLYFATLYCLFLVVAPLIYCAIKMWKANSTKEYHHVSIIFKWIIFFGIISIVIINQNIIQNV